jgi:exodeoxyribonuclease V alpha subunit
LVSLAASDHQREAAARAMAGPVGLLTGTPGTGKTFVTAQVIKAVRDLVPPDEVAVVAPTGKAAVRITRALHDYGVDVEATTVHRLLQIAGKTADGFKFAHNRDNPLPLRVVFLDEASMLDVDLAAALVAALAPGTHLLLVGDPYQLPPVGHGAPLRDLLAAGLPAGELTEIRRNSGMIVEACRDIKNGYRYKTCDKFDDAGNNFRSVECGRGLVPVAVFDVAARLDGRGGLGLAGGHC